MKLLRKNLTLKREKATAVNDLSGKMDTVVTSMTSTEGQLKELEKQALQLQRIAEEEAQAKVAQEAAAQNKQSKLLKRASSTSTSTCRASRTGKQWWTSSKRRA